MRLEPTASCRNSALLDAARSCIASLICLTGLLSLHAPTTLAQSGPSARSATTASSTDYAMATPNQGEGIWSLLRRNGIKPMPASVAEFKTLNADRLRGRESLRTDIPYRLPGGTRASTHSIFGAKYERVVHKSSALEGNVYYLVGGHGGPDPGSIGTYRGKRVYEDEIAYDTMLRTARELIAHGATVEIIIQDDDGIRDEEHLKGDKDERHADGSNIALNPLKRLKARTELINELYRKHRATAREQRVLAFHVDATGLRVEPQIDVHFVHATPGGYAVSRTLSNTMRAKYAAHQPGRGYHARIEQRNLYILKNTIPVAVLVELGNIRHQGDQIRLMKPANRQALAEWLTDGILAEAGVISL